VSALTKAKAAAFAHAVNLQGADLLGMSPLEPEHERQTRNRALEHCVGINTALRIVNVDSAKFASVVDAQHEQIRSSVEVLPNAALAARNDAAAQSRRAISCAERFFPRELPKTNGSRVHFGHMRITRLPNPWPGVAGSFGIRVAVPILGVPTAVESTQPVLYIDGFSFLAGPAEISMVATAFPQPVSEEVEARLAGLLYSRANAHKL